MDVCVLAELIAAFFAGTALPAGDEVGGCHAVAHLDGPSEAVFLNVFTKFIYLANEFMTLAGRLIRDAH